MARMTEAERERLANIERNKKLLAQLGLDDVKNTVLATKPKPQPPAKESKKRKPKADEGKENDENGEDGRPHKSARVADAAAGDDGETTLRRSRRNAGKKIDYAEIEQDRSARTYRVAHVQIEMEGEPRSVNKRTQNPCVSSTFYLMKLAQLGPLSRKQYGHIPGVEIGAWWETR